MVADIGGRFVLPVSVVNVDGREKLSHVVFGILPVSTRLVFADGLRFLLEDIRTARMTLTLRKL